MESLQESRFDFFRGDVMKNKKLRNFFILGCCSVVAVVAVGLLINFEIIDAYTAQILTLAGINAIMALSVNIICGITGQLSLGQAGFMAIGAYSSVLIANAGIPLPLSIVLAGLVTAFFVKLVANLVFVTSNCTFRNASIVGNDDFCTVGRLLSRISIIIGIPIDVIFDKIA